MGSVSPVAPGGPNTKLVSSDKVAQEGIVEDFEKVVQSKSMEEAVENIKNADSTKALADSSIAARMEKGVNGFLKSVAILTTATLFVIPLAIGAFYYRDADAATQEVAWTPWTFVKELVWSASADFKSAIFGVPVKIETIEEKYANLAKEIQAISERTRVKTDDAKLQGIQKGYLSILKAGTALGMIFSWGVSLGTVLGLTVGPGLLQWGASAVTGGDTSHGKGMALAPFTFFATLIKGSYDDAKDVFKKDDVNEMRKAQDVSGGVFGKAQPNPEVR